jgi:hypothetical protein
VQTFASDFKAPIAIEDNNETLSYPVKSTSNLPKASKPFTANQFSQSFPTHSSLLMMNFLEQVILNPQ